MPEILITRTAEKDLRRIGRGPERQRIIEGLQALAADADNLDIKAVVGATPWRRLRIGNYRVLYWLRPDHTYEIRRIVHRRDLDATAATLPETE